MHGDPEDEPVVLAALAELVDNSLLARRCHDEGTPRFSFLEMVREYAIELLAMEDDEWAVHRRYAAVMLDLARAAEPHLVGPFQRAWLERLEREHDNLRSALSWAALHMPPLLADLAAALWRFWQLRGYVDEGRRWLARALGGEASLLAERRAQLLLGAGNLAWTQGDLGGARALLEAALVCYRAQGDQRGIAEALNGLGTVAAGRGDYLSARALHEESAALALALGDRPLRASTTHGLGLVAYFVGEYPLGIELLAESRAISADCADLAGEGWSLCVMALIRHAQGRLETASALLDESRVAFGSLGEKMGTAVTLLVAALVAHERGEFDRAATDLAASLVLCDELGDGTALAWVHHARGRLAHDRHRWDEALTDFTTSLTFARAVGDPWALVWVLHSLGALARDRGDDRRAASLFGESLRLARDVRYARDVARNLEGIAAVLCGDEATLAARLCGAAGALRRRIGAPLLPTERAHWRGLISQLRTALGGRSFVSRWDEGWMLDAETATALALATIQDLPAR